MTRFSASSRRPRVKSRSGRSAAVQKCRPSYGTVSTKSSRFVSHHMKTCINIFQMQPSCSSGRNLGETSCLTCCGGIRTITSSGNRGIRVADGGVVGASAGRCPAPAAVTWTQLPLTYPASSLSLFPRSATSQHLQPPWEPASWHS